MRRPPNKARVLAGTIDAAWVGMAQNDDNSIVKASANHFTEQSGTNNVAAIRWPSPCPGKHVGVLVKMRKRFTALSVDGFFGVFKLTSGGELVSHSAGGHSAKRR